MPLLPQPKSSQLLRIKSRPLEFSFWPVERTTRRYGLGTRIFASDPWTVINRSVERRCLAATKGAAFALIEQAKDFYDAGESGVKDAKPLLMYYCMMNLAKAFVLCSRKRTDVNNAVHGLSEKLDPAPYNIELINAWLEASKNQSNASQTQKIKVFDELLNALSGIHIPTNRFRYDLLKLLPQIVPGHRLWAEAASNAEKERFVSLERIEFRQDQAAKTIWLRLYLCADDLKRINITHQDFIQNARLGTMFGEVASTEAIDERPLICLEQINSITYHHRPADNIPALVSQVKEFLWRTVLSAPPYRKYYCYSAPTTEHQQVLPQILSIYAVTYYLGSIVRYRPHHFDRILQDRYGPFVEAFLNDQPRQFVYLMASEFAEKEVTRAGIV